MGHRVHSMSRDSGKDNTSWLCILGGVSIASASLAIVSWSLAKQKEAERRVSEALKTVEHERVEKLKTACALAAQKLSALEQEEAANQERMDAQQPSNSEASVRRLDAAVACMAAGNKGGKLPMAVVFGSHTAAMHAVLEVAQSNAATGKRSTINTACVICSEKGRTADPDPDASPNSDTIRKATGKRRSGRWSRRGSFMV